MRISVAIHLPEGQRSAVMRGVKKSKGIDPYSEMLCKAFSIVLNDVHGKTMEVRCSASVSKKNWDPISLCA